MKVVLDVKGLQKSYGNQAVFKDVSFHVKEGEIFGLLGHNGAGKSTFIDCALGLKKYQAGSINILGQDSNHLSNSIYEAVGVQFQHSHYQDKLKVKELCELTSSYYKDVRDYRELLRAFDLQNLENSFVENLSGGEQQKLSVLLTLIQKPKLIFLDELTTGLDTIARRKIWKYLAAMKEYGVSIFLTSHYMDEVEVLCDRIAILMDGEIKVCGSVAEVIASSGKKTLEDAYIWYCGEDLYENI